MTASGNNEARGERAYERIKAEARNARISQNYPNNQDRYARRNRPTTSSSYPNRRQSGRRATNTQQSKNDNAGRTEDDAIAEAISRSLADGEPPSSSSACLAKPEQGKKYEADLAKAKRTSLIGNSDKQDRFDHTPNLPYAPLRYLHDDLHTTAMMLQAHAQKQEKVSPARVRECVREWEGTVFKVVHELEKAEAKRIKDIDKRIDLDMEIERRYQKKLQRMDQMWEAKMAAREEEWEAKLEAQRQIYQAKLTDQECQRKTASNEKQQQERQARRSSSAAQSDSSSSSSKRKRDEEKEGGARSSPKRSRSNSLGGEDTH